MYTARLGASFYASSVQRRFTSVSRFLAHVDI